MCIRDRLTTEAALVVELDEEFAPHPARSSAPHNNSTMQTARETEIWVALAMRRQFTPDYSAVSNAEKPTPKSGLSLNYAGDHLISHTLTRAVPSALSLIHISASNPRPTHPETASTPIALTRVHP